MSSLKLVGWKPGLRTVSLILAVRKYTGASLEASKAMVERLLAGEAVIVSCLDGKTCELFAKEAEQLGAVVEIL